MSAATTMETPYTVQAYGSFNPFLAQQAASQNYFAPTAAGAQPYVPYSSFALQQTSGPAISQAAYLPNQTPPPQPHNQSRPGRQAGSSHMLANPNLTCISPPNTSSNTQLVAVVVTIARGASYDRLFQDVPQQSAEGTRVATYTATGRSLSHLLRAFRTNDPIPSNPAWADFRQLLTDIRLVDAASVVFNWECCAGCSCEAFGDHSEGQHPREIVMDLMELLLQRGHMVMVSDFSLKALIKQWSERRLGPNPFKKLGEFGGTMRLNFEPEILAACPSAQLQKAGEMSEDGTAQVHAMPSTIAYTVDATKADTSRYTLQVLTVASQMQGIDIDDLPPHLLCSSGGHRGAAGHVLLQYPSGGRLLASAGHWVELAHIGVSEQRLLDVAASSYGAAYSADVQRQFESCPTAGDRAQLVQSMASQYIQQSVPCAYSAARTI